ncbi:T9SS type A sorting domain-containing protein [Patescibacteria group bacterium]|nr:T9SS type A sorting domain-containing protein [Patescibacteria group bacterium]
MSRSVYADFDGKNYNGIVVGSNVTWNMDKRIYETNYGFVKINDDALINLGPSGLNFITGNDDKIVIVGDGGNVFLGKRTYSSDDQSMIAKNDLVITNENNSMQIKSSEIINKINIFDISGKLITTISSNKMSETLATNNFPMGIYLIQVDEKVKKVLIK